MNEDKSPYWISLAEYDLETAKAMLITKRYLYVGFMCHQVVEKAFKAIIAKDGYFPPKIHNLVRLAELGGLITLLDEKQKNLINMLIPLNIEARYPSSKEKLAKTLNERICDDLIEKTGEMLVWIKTML
jgi:HEPN domain-containing protein